MNAGLSKHIYLFLKVITSFCFRLYSRRFQVAGDKSFVPNNVATIFASNHQNALTDPLNIIYSLNRYRRPLFLARADVFKKNLVPIFNLFRMSPIYRTRDGVDVKEANDEVFETCIENLMRHDCIGIFPEGSHLGVNHVRPLKKGLARIVFAAAERSNFTLPILVIPVGLLYEDFFKFQKNCLINHTQGIKAENYYELYKENPSKALVDLTRDIRHGMMDASIHIELESLAPIVEAVRKVFAKNYQTPSEVKYGDMMAELQAGKKISARVHAWAETASPEEKEEILKQFQAYEQALENLNLRDKIVAERPATLLKQIGTFTFVVLTTPFFIFGYLFNIVPFHIVGTKLHTMFKDPHYTSSIRAIGSIPIFGIWYILICSIAGAIAQTPWGFLLTALLGMVTGIFSITWSGVLKKWSARKRMRTWKRKQDSRWNALLEQRNALLQWHEALPDAPIKVYSKSV